MAANDYTLHTLKHLAPSWLSFVFPALHFRAAVLFQHGFDHSIDALINGTTQILAHCRISLDSLESITDSLSVAHALTSREDVMPVEEHDHTLRPFWTAPGDNRDRLRALGQQLSFLKGMVNHRAKALRHIQWIMDGVLDIRVKVSLIQAQLAEVDRSAFGEMAQDIEVQLYSISEAITRVSECMEDTRKKKQRLEANAGLEWGRGDTEVTL